MKRLLPTEPPDDAFTRRIANALEALPAVRISPDFASRTAALAVAQVGAAAATPRPRFVSLASWSALALLLAAMLACPEVAGFAPAKLAGTELLLALEFVALTTWLSLRPAGRS